MKKSKIELGSCFLVAKDYSVELFIKMDIKGNNITFEEYDSEEGVYYFRSSNPYVPCFGLDWSELNQCIKKGVFVLIKIEDLTSDKFSYLRDDNLATVTFDKKGNYKIKK